MPDLGDYIGLLIGKPWARGAEGPEAFDCWSFASMVQRELLGRDLPLAASLGIDTADSRAVIETIRSSPLQRQWMPVEARAHGDLVLMTRVSRPCHVGVWIDAEGLRGVLHCGRNLGVVLQTEAQVRAQWSRLDFRRPAEAALKAVSSADEKTLKAAFEGMAALVVEVADPLDPLAGAIFRPVPDWQGEAGPSVASLVEDAASGRWIVRNTTPLLRCHPETGEDEWLAPARRGDVIWVLPPPPEGDDTGKAVLGILAAIVVAYAAPYASVAILGEVAGSVGALTTAGQVLSTAIAIGGNLLIQTVLSASSPLDASSSPDGASPTYTNSPAGNQLRPGAQVPTILGTMNRQPEYLARPWGEFIDNEHFLYSLFCVGAGEYQVNEIGIEDTAIWQAGVLTGALSDVEIEIVAPGDRVTLFPADVATSAEVGGQTAPAAVGAAETTLGPFVAVPSGQTTNRIAMDFAFARGLFRLSDSGKEKTATVSWRVEMREIDALDAPVGGWIEYFNPPVTMATTTPQRLTREWSVLEGRYEVRITRTNETEIEGGRGQDELSWVGLRAFLPGDQRYDDVTALAVRARASETSQQARSLWYVDATRIGSYWDGAAWVTGPTEAIEAAALHILRSEDGLGLPDAQIDLDALAALAGTWAARGDVCCLAIDSPQGCWDILEAVLKTGRTIPQLIGSVVTFTRDEPRPFASQLITDADIVRGSLQVTRHHYRRESPNAVRARFWDRNRRQGEVLCVPPGVVDPRPATIDFPGIVDRDQVFREGVTMAAVSDLRRVFLSFTMLDQGRSLLRGEKIAVAHPRPAYGNPARVKRNAWPTLELTRPHGVEAATGWMRLAQPNGGDWGPVMVAIDGPQTVTVDLVDAARIAAEPLLGRAAYDLDPANWIIDEESLSGETGFAAAGRQSEPTRASVGADAPATAAECIVAAMRPREGGAVEVLAAIDHPGVYTADTGVVPAAPVASALSPIATAPVWAGARAEITDASGQRRIEVSGPAVPGASLYRMEISVDAGANWRLSGSAPVPLLQAPVPDEAQIEVRWQAVGLLAGPFGFATLDGTVQINPLAGIGTINERTALDGDYRFDWNAIPDALIYEVRIFNNAVQVRAAETAVPRFNYPSAVQETDGGPWRSIDIEVRPVNGAEDGPWQSASAVNPAPAAATGLAVSGITETSATASWSSGDPTTRGYLYDLLEGSTSVQSGETTATSLALTGLVANSSYTLEVSSFDNIKTGLNTASVSFVTPTGS